MGKLGFALQFRHLIRFLIVCQRFSLRALFLKCLSKAIVNVCGIRIKLHIFFEGLDGFVYLLVAKECVAELVNNVFGRLDLIAESLAELSIMTLQSEQRLD